jgi:predicted nucleotidyltransferase component of viral defense system
MLYTNTVEPTTLSILKKLMSIKELESFYLVGGTCLSLRYGHRKSTDLDLFSIKEFTNEWLIEILAKEKIPFEYRSTNNPIGQFGFIENVKIDFVKHHYFTLINETITEDGVRMFSSEDIMAMKVFAILKRAHKKDFWDVAELLQHYSFNDFVKAYSAKYPSMQLTISLPYALSYFADANESEDPISLKGQTWDSVQKIIQRHVNQYLQ